jgi:hypothetical protein
LEEGEKMIAADPNILSHADEVAPTTVPDTSGTQENPPTTVKDGTYDGDDQQEEQETQGPNRITEQNTSDTSMDGEPETNTTLPTASIRKSNEEPTLNQWDPTNNQEITDPTTSRRKRKQPVTRRSDFLWPTDPRTQAQCQ